MDIFLLFNATEQKTAVYSPSNWKQFPLSSGERAGVRVIVKLIIPRAYNRMEVRYYLSFDSAGSW